MDWKKKKKKKKKWCAIDSLPKMINIYLKAMKDLNRKSAISNQTSNCLYCKSQAGKIAGETPGNAPAAEAVQADTGLEFIRVNCAISEASTDSNQLIRFLIEAGMLPCRLTLISMANFQSHWIELHLKLILNRVWIGFEVLHISPLWFDNSELIQLALTAIQIWIV